MPGSLAAGSTDRAVSLVAELKAARDLGTVRRIHAACTALEGDLAVANVLVNVYAKNGGLHEAVSVFDGMEVRDAVSWNSLAFGYVENGEGQRALDLFCRMRAEGRCKPSALSYVAAVKSCSRLAADENGQLFGGRLRKVASLEKGRAVHSDAVSSCFDSDVQVANTLIDMYANCGSLVEAQTVFHAMQQPDVVSWNALMFGYAENGKGSQALELFVKMDAEPNPRSFVAVLKACASLAAGNLEESATLAYLIKGQAIHALAASRGWDSHVIVANTVVDMYARCRTLEDARRVFDNLQQRTSVSWNVLMFGYVDNGHGQLALELLASMRREGYVPDARTLVAALKAWGMMLALDAGRSIHAEICSRGCQEDPVIVTALVDFYGKCGCMAEAQQVFDTIDKKDIVVWNALMSGYSRHGDTQKVLQLFKEIKDAGHSPDEVTMVCILSACSHAGLFEEGKDYFRALVSRFGIVPDIEHYHCMLDILGRANQLEDALALVESMPFQPTAVTWTTILDACRKWKNVEVGRYAFEALMRLEDKDVDSAHLLMASIYQNDGY